MRFKPKKSLGQNFLIDRNILKIISNNGNIKSNHTIIEIGPGSGNLTSFLIDENPKKIITIEKDENLVKKLKIKFYNKINLINDDFLKIDLNFLRKDNIIVFGNLPYNISSQILIRLIKLKIEGFKIEKFILMFQKEVAERIIANHDTNQYGRLSIISQWSMNITKIMDIKPSSFYPVPKVNSTLLSFVPKKNFFKLEKIKTLEHVTNVFFNLRRKMVRKPMNILFEDANIISEKLKINLNSRPQNISPINYYKICKEYEKLLY